MPNTSASSTHSPSASGAAIAPCPVSTALMLCTMRVKKATGERVSARYTASMAAAASESAAVSRLNSMSAPKSENARHSAAAVHTDTGAENDSSTASVSDRLSISAISTDAPRSVSFARRFISYILSEAAASGVASIMAYARSPALFPRAGALCQGLTVSTSMPASSSRFLSIS